MRGAKGICIILVLLLAVSLSACGTAPAELSPPAEPDTWLMNFPGTEWGMTPEEVCGALSLDAGSYEERSDEHLYLEGIRMSLFGAKDAYVVFTFDDQNGDGVYTLYRISAALPHDADMEAVKSTMTQWYGEPSEDTETKVLWASGALQRDIMSEEEAAYLEAQNDMAARLLTDPATTVSWTTSSYSGFSLDGEWTNNLLIFDSNAAFYAQEGGFTAQIESAE